MHPFPVTSFFANALQFAFDRATIEGKATIGVLLCVSLFSWSVIISKSLQLARARRLGRRFLQAYHKTTHPCELRRRGERFDGAPAYALYRAGIEELELQLQKSIFAARAKGELSPTRFEAVRVAIEEAAIREALTLEKGMVVLSTAVAGGPFIGLLGTVWGVMDTFAGIAKANAATLTAMAPGVAGALIATVVGLLVAIPAMFAYNFMVTRIRALTQELDSFGIRLATQIEQEYLSDQNPTLGVGLALESEAKVSGTGDRHLD
jgi:biopolymer transport protein ExbB/TolQ